MIVRSRAPLRISLAGGGTDVPPYCDQFGGLVLNFTIAKYAYCSVVPRDDSTIRVQSIDLNSDLTGEVGVELPCDGNLDLAKVVLNRFEGRGADITIESQVPPGSGLGSSSAVAVALIGALTAASGRPIRPYEVAHLAWVAERIDLGIRGGKQDQYACAFGGWNSIEFTAASVLVHPLRLPEEVQSELQFRMLLCYTGGARKDGRIMDQQIENYQAQKPDVMESLHMMRSIAGVMRKDLLQGRIDSVGRLLHEGWELKQRLAPGVATDAAGRLYEIACSEGAIGGKLLGAGGGGYLLVMVRPERRRAVAEALEAAGGRVEAVVPEPDGLRVWYVDQMEATDPNRIPWPFLVEARR